MNSSTPYRVTSIDVLRGLVMVIMALDHTRDFFHRTAVTADPLNPATTTTLLFFTRWITHFCAPTFVFLSGVSAFLAAQRRTKQEAALFLIKRGLWLVVVEITLITLGLTFNPFYNFIILQVIWAIGWSMVILGLLSWWSWNAVLVVGVLLFFGHNVVDYMKFPAEGPASVVWLALLTARGAVVPLNATHLVGVFYVVLPWTGIMLPGYCMGRWFTRDFPAEKRKRRLIVTGMALITLFVVLRWINWYGDPVPRKIYPDLWSNVLSFLDASKYPPSLQFAGMTLGPALLALAAFERIQQKWSKVLSVYGRVPFFYYVLHFYLLHTVLVIAFFAAGYHPAQIAQVPFWFRPADFGYALPGVYLVWVGVVAALYRPCLWFDRYRGTHRQWWLSYL
ncbi:DUF1624 domain-containing protein [Chitinophaga qingshengii]|uniref:DUF1624 domain-containing protein n=1 Tax=Chitinophaga qingshengii TaxID=1569794 RepID=A0ABR7TF34_9BACT|nr:heparan-alpha-glucosaminide N-acetyltransferase domain-containing protein [Chitinophaga qingshengii]MBC9928864.1 DUF1624 domain-containing protein [Chitinophaga qingshengii]